MQVRDIMTRQIESIISTDSLVEAARKMKLYDIGVLPVIGDGEIVGILTDRDIVVRAIAEGKDLYSTTSGEVMTPNPVTILEDSSVEDAARIMEEKQIRRLLVLGSNNMLTGIFSLGDLALSSHDRQLSGEALERISEPTLVHA